MNLWDERAELLLGMRGAGVRFALAGPRCPARYLVPEGFDPLLMASLRHHHIALTEALWHEAGLCVGCGGEPAAHPNMEGRRQVFDARGFAALRPSARLHKLFGYQEVVWEACEAPARLKAASPMIWCDHCWDDGTADAWIVARLRACGPVPQIVRAADEKERLVRPRARASEQNESLNMEDPHG